MTPALNIAACFGLLFGATSCILGDRLPREISVIVRQVSGVIVFDLPEAERSKITSLYEVAVSRSSDENENADREIVWHLRMDNRIFRDAPQIRWPLAYGSSIANAVLLTAPKPMRPGRYRFNADAALLRPAGLQESDSMKKLLVDFVVGEDLKLRR